jgi:hypothetical protein
MKRDSKDPLPTADNSMRDAPDGNSPATGEKHGSKKAQYISGDQRFTLRTGGESQPTRQGEAGNTPATGEMHNSKKAERVTAAQRGGENTGGSMANSPGR